jgi:alpha-tubulin suppressor-like RCC1 family protein
VLGSLNRKCVEFVSCGGMHTCCITSDGYAHSFGLNKNGQLGTGDLNNKYEPGKSNYNLKPIYS